MAKQQYVTLFFASLGRKLGYRKDVNQLLNIRQLYGERTIPVGQGKWNSYVGSTRMPPQLAMAIMDRNDKTPNAEYQRHTKWVIT